MDTQVVFVTHPAAPVTSKLASGLAKLLADDLVAVNSGKKATVLTVAEAIENEVRSDSIIGIAIDALRRKGQTLSAKVIVEAVVEQALAAALAGSSVVVVAGFPQDSVQTALLRSTGGPSGRHPGLAVKGTVVLVTKGNGGSDDSVAAADAMLLAMRGDDKQRAAVAAATVFGAVVKVNLSAAGGVAPGDDESAVPVWAAHRTTVLRGLSGRPLSLAAGVASIFGLIPRAVARAYRGWSQLPTGLKMSTAVSATLMAAVVAAVGYNRWWEWNRRTRYRIRKQEQMTMNPMRFRIPVHSTFSVDKQLPNVVDEVPVIGDLNTTLRANIIPAAKR